MSNRGYINLSKYTNSTKTVLTLFLLISIFILPNISLALDPCSTGICETRSEVPTLGGDIAYFAGNIIKALLSLLGVIVLIFMVYGGYLWMASGGNEQMVKKSKDILFNTIIGLIIVIAAFAITDFIMKGITGAVNSSGSASSESASCADAGGIWACSLNDGTGSCSEQGPDCSCWCGN